MIGAKIHLKIITNYMVELRLGFDFDAIRSVCPSMPLFLFVVFLVTNAHDCQILNYFMTQKRNEIETREKTSAKT